MAVPTESQLVPATTIEKLSDGIQNLLTQLNSLLENRLNDSQKLEQQFSDYMQRMQNLNEEIREQYKREREQEGERERIWERYLDLDILA